MVDKTTGRLKRITIELQHKTLMHYTRIRNYNFQILKKVEYIWTLRNEALIKIK